MRRASATGADCDAGGADDVHLLDYVKVLYKRRWTARHGVPASSFGRVTVYTFTATPIFEARAQLLIEKENANVVTFKEVVEQNQTDRRLLPDAVQHPAEPRAGAADDRRAEAVEAPAVRRSRDDSVQREERLGAPSACVAAGSRPRRRPTTRPSADETAAQSRRDRRVPARA